MLTEVQSYFAINICVINTFFQDKVAAIREIFPSIDQSVLIDTLHQCDGDTSDAAQMLLLRTPASDPTHITVSGSGGDPCHNRDVEQIPGEMSMTDIMHRRQSDRPFDMVGDQHFLSTRTVFIIHKDSTFNLELT